MTRARFRGGPPTGVTRSKPAFSPLPPYGAPESGTRSCRRMLRGVTIYHRFALQQRSQTMRWFMYQRTLYAAILLLVGLFITGIPGYGTAEPPIAPPPDALQNTTPSGFPPCPEPMPNTMPPSTDPTKPPMESRIPVVPGIGAPACDGTRFGVRSNPPPGVPPPPLGPCPEECQRLLRPEDREKYFK